MFGNYDKKNKWKLRSVNVRIQVAKERPEADLNDKRLDEDSRQNQQENSVGALRL